LGTTSRKECPENPHIENLLTVWKISTKERCGDKSEKKDCARKQEIGEFHFHRPG
jgi:hypothetical protein